MTATRRDIVADLKRRIAELDQQVSDTRAERDEAVAQQQASAEIMQVINASPGDLAPVFGAMVDKATALCGASFGVLWVRDDGAFRAAASRGVPGALQERIGRPISAHPQTGLGRILSGESLVINFDLGLAECESEGTLGRLEAGCWSIEVALRMNEELLGALTVYRRGSRAFSDRHVGLLQTFAAQAVIAMENARLLTETLEALDQQAATAEIVRVINTSPGDPKPVFDAMLEKALRLCDAACGLLQTYDGLLVRTVATRGVTREFAEHLAIPRPLAPGTNHDRLVRGESFVHVEDIRDTELYRVGVAQRRGAADLGGQRTIVSVAMRKGDDCLGFFHIFRKEVRPFTEKQVRLLQNFAAQAVIAMENARLLGELRKSTEEVAALNRDLEARVAEQVDELGRVGRLKRFLAPQLAELIVSQGDENILESHRREIVVVFCDLRGYTAFTETAEPEEVLNFLREYHGALGPLVSQFEGTLDQFSGDGIMVFFNDPVPIPDPAERAVKMAVAMREAASKLTTAWRQHGCDLGFGIGIAQGYATLGQIGFAERSGYTAIGTVCNLAARLCAEAKDGQILISSRVAVAAGTDTTLENLGNLELKGLSRPVAAFNVAQGSIPAAARPNLSVVAMNPRA
jgi:class 3 adenylate cyclase